MRDGVIESDSRRCIRRTNGEVLSYEALSSGHGLTRLRLQARHRALEGCDRTLHRSDLTRQRLYTLHCEGDEALVVEVEGLVWSKGGRCRAADEVREDVLYVLGNEAELLLCRASTWDSVVLPIEGYRVELIDGSKSRGGIEACDVVLEPFIRERCITYELACGIGAHGLA